MAVGWPAMFGLTSTLALAQAAVTVRGAIIGFDRACVGSKDAGRKRCEGIGKRGLQLNDPLRIVDFPRSGNSTFKVTYLRGVSRRRG